MLGDGGDAPQLQLAAKRKFTCPVCTKTYTNEGSYRKHVAAMKCGDSLRQKRLQDLAANDPAFFVNMGFTLNSPAQPQADLAVRNSNDLPPLVVFMDHSQQKLSFIPDMVPDSYDYDSFAEMFAHDGHHQRLLPTQQQTPPPVPAIVPLGAHVQRGHKRKADANEQHQCRRCNQLFESARNKNKHERDVHGRAPIEQQEKPARAGKLKQFDSAIVTKAVNEFKKSTSNNNGKAQPLTCILCSHHAVATKPTFLRHIKSHDMTKEFACSFCPEVFTRKSSAKEHVHNKHPENSAII
jgi:hypothetical protein